MKKDHAYRWSVQVPPLTKLLHVIRLTFVLFFAGMMSADLRNIIVEAVESLPATEAEARAQLAVSLAITSAEFVVQK